VTEPHGPLDAQSNDARLGAYGLALTGDALGSDAGQWLPTVPDDWPVWTVERRTAAPEHQPPGHEINEAGAHLRLYDGGAATVATAERHITLYLHENEPTAAVLHPVLAPVFMVIAHAQGILNFHAGVVLLHGRAWGVLGHKGAGKSTTLAALDRLGHPVLSDDLLVLDGDDALIGPRFIDLRRRAADRFPGAVDCGQLGLRTRYRLPLAPAPSRAPFAGWLVPAWDDELAAQPVPPQERIALLADLLSVKTTPKNPLGLLELATRPMLRISRPRDFELLPAYLDLLVDATAQAAAV